MIRRLISIVTLIIAIGGVSYAQTATETVDFGSFSGISASEGFSVRLVKAGSFSVTSEVDTLIRDYVEVYANGGIVYLDYDRKGLPSEIKKVYRGRRSADPVLKVTVSCPRIESINLSSATLDATSFENDPKSFSLVASGASEVTGLDVKCNSALFNLSGSSRVSASVEADEIDVSTSGSSKIGLSQMSKKLVVSSEGTSGPTIEGVCDEVEIEASGSSKPSVSGTTESLSIKSSGVSSKVQTGSLKAKSASVTSTGGSSVHVNASDALRVDITGASVYFDGSPALEIVRVSKGTLMPEGTSATPTQRQGRRGKASRNSSGDEGAKAEDNAPVTITDPTTV